jgi:hypothetical protein
MSYRAAFLIVCASVIFHLSGWGTLFVLAAYWVASYADNWMEKSEARKARDKAFEDDCYGWEQDSYDPNVEIKGSMTRPRLTQREQDIVTRIAELLRRMPCR